MSQRRCVAASCAVMGLMAFASVAANDQVRFETTDGEPLPDAEQEVAESVLNVDVLQPGVYRLEVDAEARQARIIEALPAADAADSGHRTSGE